MNQKEENITIQKGQEFTIALESNPTSGYRWLPAFNTSIINLISHDFQPTSPRLIGSSGNDIFKFKAISNGTATLKVFYKRGWEVQIVEEKIFYIDVK
jgi:inhibitor of cysteine peptidase